MAKPSATMDERHIRCAEMTFMGVQTNAIAEALGVERITIWRWRRRPDVAAYMASLRDAAHAATHAVIVGAATRAAEVIVEKMDSGDERVAFNAAQDILNRGGHPKGERLDLGGAVATTEMTPAQAAAAFRAAQGVGDGGE